MSKAPAPVLIGLGAAAAIGGYLVMHTQVLLAYRGGTLADVHALCANAIAAIASNGSCSQINAYYTLASVALWGGLMLAGIGLLILLLQRRDASRPLVVRPLLRG